MRWRAWFHTVALGLVYMLLAIVAQTDGRSGGIGNPPAKDAATVILEQHLPAATSPSISRQPT